LKKLIVNADDFGLTSGVNRGIIEAHRCGIVTSATLMVNMPACEEAAALAQENKGLAVGLHLNLVDGRPVADPRQLPTLVDTSGYFFQRPRRLIKRLLLGRIRQAEVEIELRAQIEKGLKLLSEITHLDVHKHLHFHPLVLDVVLRLARAYGIKRIRWPRERGLSLAQALVGAGKSSGIIRQFVAAKTLSAFFALQERQVQGSGILRPDGCYGITYTGFLDARVLLRIIRSLPAGISELICHPGYDTRELNGVCTRLRSERERELRALTDPDVIAEISAQGITLINYSHLN
jgi:hopanoid biosynthesis associated protein HpnK